MSASDCERAAGGVRTELRWLLGRWRWQGLRSTAWRRCSARRRGSGTQR